MKNQLSILQILVIVLIPMSFYGQSNYFPGGLGNSNLKIWLNAANASSLTYNGSNQVSQWSDLSNNGFHFAQSTTGNQPIYSATGGPNSRPTISFTRANSQFLSMPLLPGSISFTSGVSTFSIVNFASSGAYERIYDFGNSNESDNLIAGRYFTSDNFFYEVWSGNLGAQSYTTSNPITNGTPRMYEAIQAGGVAGTNTTVSFYSAGSSQASNGTFGSQTRVPAATNRTLNYVGRSNWGADAYLDASISEILFYNTALNTTQRTIIENYLSAGWGMAISSSNFTPPSPTSYNRNLVGIGYTSISDNVVSNPAGTTDGFGFSSGTGVGDFLNSAGYLMAAHNGQTNSLLNNQNIVGVSTPDVSRMNRSWYVQKTGGNAAGNVTLSFNFNDYNGTGLPGGAISYGLIYHPTDGSFSTGTTTLLTNNFSFSGSQISFQLPTSSIANGYYSIVWSSIFTLPVRLSNFSATKNKDAVELNWKTDVENELSHFEVERSSSGRDFKLIASVQTVAASTTKSYLYSDKQPLPGTNFYRLVFVDKNGNKTFSPLRTIVFEKNQSADPFVISQDYNNSIVRINMGDYKGRVDFQITNSSGQLIFKATRNSSATEIISIQTLNKGIYFLTVITKKDSFTKKFMKG